MFNQNILNFAMILYIDFLSIQYVKIQAVALSNMFVYILSEVISSYINM